MSHVYHDFSVSTGQVIGKYLLPHYILISIQMLYLLYFNSGYPNLRDSPGAVEKKMIYL